MEKKQFRGEIFPIMQRLKRANIPVLSVAIEKREAVDYHNKGELKWYAVFDADCWAAKKAQHPFEGCNPDFTIWDSKIRGKAKIAILIP